MSACVDQELLLGGLVDNELDAANIALVEAHVARCEGCREELERLQAVRSLLADRRRSRHGAAKRWRGASRPCRNCRRRARERNRLPGWLAPGAGRSAGGVAGDGRAAFRRATRRWSTRNSCRATSARSSRGT